MIILGGGYIALEIAQAYRRLGTEIILLQRSSHVLSNQSQDIAGELTRHLTNEGMNIYTGLDFIEVEEKNGKIHVIAEQNGERKTFYQPLKTKS